MNENNKTKNEGNNMPVCYMMVGVPGSGKSSAIAQLKSEMPHLKTVSSDEYIDKIALKQGKKYSEVHCENVDDATKWMNAQIQSFIKNKVDFIWDQTNVVQTARLKKIRNLKANGYEITAITFEITREELQKRLTRREKETGKYISVKIVEKMIEEYVRPDYSEGFSLIVLISDNGVPVEIPKNQKNSNI